MSHSEAQQQGQAGPVTVYRIVVRGRLDPSWGERLAGLEVRPDESDLPGPGQTVLLGPLQDQAALSGVLNALHELRLALLSVETLGEERPERKGEER